MPRVSVAARRKAVARASVAEVDCAEAERASSPRAKRESTRESSCVCGDRLKWRGQAYLRGWLPNPSDVHPTHDDDEAVAMNGAPGW